MRRYTYGTNAVTENRTFVNIKEREGFIIEPFTASIATAAVAYTLNRDDYVFDAAYDVNRNAAFLSAGKRFDEKTAAKARFLSFSLWACTPPNALRFLRWAQASCPVLYATLVSSWTGAFLPTKWPYLNVCARGCVRANLLSALNPVLLNIWTCRWRIPSRTRLR